jgi:hypothetical protein
MIIRISPGVKRKLHEEKGGRCPPTSKMVRDAYATRLFVTRGSTRSSSIPEFFNNQG